MPSVFTVEGACPWMLKKGRKVKGCYQSEAAANRAAGSGWRPVFSRPLGVPMGRGGLGLPRCEHEEWAYTDLRIAQAHLEQALRTENCRDVPKMLALAAERHGRAYAQWKGIGAGFGRRAGRKSTQLRRAIFRVGKRIHGAMAKYAAGPCVRRSAYDK